MTERSVFILAAGEGKRWHQGQVWPVDLPKQLLPIADTTIIQRTIDMVRERGYEPVVVTYNQRIIEALPDVEFWFPAGRRWLIETLMSTRPRWSEINTVLWSDVIYSPAILDAMLTDESGIKFYGKWGDGFGLVFHGDNARIIEGCAAVIHHAEHSNKDKTAVGRSWELYRWFNGGDLDTHTGTEKSNTIFERVPDDDYTCDVDTHEDWQRVQNTVLERLKV